jgi:hypothetical protein
VTQPPRLDDDAATGIIDQSLVRAIDLSREIGADLSRRIAHAQEGIIRASLGNVNREIALAMAYSGELTCTVNPAGVLTYSVAGRPFLEMHPPTFSAQKLEDVPECRLNYEIRYRMLRNE